jgi:hypothetical protein
MIVHDLLIVNHIQVAVTQPLVPVDMVVTVDQIALHVPLIESLMLASLSQVVVVQDQVQIVGWIQDK